MNTHELAWFWPGIGQAAVLALAAASASCGSNSEDAAPPRVHLHVNASVDVKESLANDPSRCPHITGRTMGTGTGGDIGVITLTTEDCVSMEDTTLIFGNGTATITVANNDELYFTYNGRLKPSAASNDVYEVDPATSMFNLVRGTGRFEGATGNGVMGGRANIKMFTGTYTFEGTITLAAGKK